MPGKARQQAWAAVDSLPHHQRPREAPDVCRIAADAELAEPRALLVHVLDVLGHGEESVANCAGAREHVGCESGHINASLEDTIVLHNEHERRAHARECLAHCATKPMPPAELEEFDSKAAASAGGSGRTQRPKVLVVGSARRLVDDAAAELDLLTFAHVVGAVARDEHAARAQLRGVVSE